MDQQNHTGRIALIFVVLLGALYFIFPQPQKLVQHLPWSQKMALKPGIDMVGGTSLLYEIKEPEGGFHTQGSQTLAEAVTEIIKKRIDPGGLKNLVWRPQGKNRLEIQIPASPENEQASKARDAYVAAERELDALNVSDSDVTAAVEHLTGPARDARLTELARGLPARTALFAGMTKAFDARQAAHSGRDAAAEAAADIQYEDSKKRIVATNLSAQTVEDAASAPTPAERSAKLADLTKGAAGFPARVAAVEKFASAATAYNALKDKVDDASQLKRELQGSGVLAFHIEADVGGTGPSAIPPATYQQMALQLKQKGPRPQAGDQYQWFQVDSPEFQSRFTQAWNGKQYLLCWTSPEKSMVNGPNTPRWAMQEANRQNDEVGRPAIAFRFDAPGGDAFRVLTGDNKGQTLVTLLDNKVISAATLPSDKAIGASGELTNHSPAGYSDDEIRYLVDTFNAGSLPGRLGDEPISEQTVGPALGSANLIRGLEACAFGLVIVAVFLISYYYLAGVVATVAVFMNVVMILGVLAAFGATFTLPGVAGIVLTIGAAVDANVLIFERLREEQHRGLSLRMALANAYDHARGAILDSNATTVITSLILMWLGSEEVKGFGTTLLIGLLSSLFTSLFVTRTIFNILIDKFGVEHLGSVPLTFPRWDRLLKPNIDWMRLVPYFLGFSVVVLAFGLTTFAVEHHRGELLDVDLSGGTQVQFDLKQPMPIEQVRDLFRKANDPTVGADPDLTGAGNDNKSYRLVSPVVDAPLVRGAVLHVMGDRLDTELPSVFAGSALAYEKAFGTGDAATVRPVMTLPFVVAGQPVKAADDYLGGVAIVMTDLNPPLRVDQIRDRIDRARVAGSSAADAGPSPLRDFAIASLEPAGVPTHAAVVFATDPTFAYDKDAAKWATALAVPAWRIVTEAVTAQGQLQQVTNFDAQVAGDAQQSALFALILSTVVIMAYIWFRFGNLKYATATVLAMLHDVLLVIGAVGLAHLAYTYVNPVARVLLVEPFRVNLTLIAAVLTVMSYSMIDTIVVFDRIRENRGKFGHLTRAVINDSINQTLSRTLLTAGTTIVTVAGMYALGGPAIHGFTFVLLIGILVGTYSSIAIAAPILLLGSEATREVQRPAGVDSLRRVAT